MKLCFSPKKIKAIFLFLLNFPFIDSAVNKQAPTRKFLPGIPDFNKILMEYDM